MWYMGAWVEGDYCSHDFNSNTLAVLADLAAFIHCHGDFLPHLFSITKENPKWKMFAAFVINVSTALVTANSVVVPCSWGNTHWPEPDGWLRPVPRLSQMGGAGSETLITLFLGTGFEGRMGKSHSACTSLVHSLNLWGVDKIVMDALGIGLLSMPLLFKWKAWWVAIYVASAVCFTFHEEIPVFSLSFCLPNCCCLS